MIGLIQIFAIATVGPLGVSTAYPQIVGAVGDRLAPGLPSSRTSGSSAPALAGKSCWSRDC
jgi:hypothetical protein